MTEHDHEDDEADGDPRVADLLREVTSISADPTEEGVERLLAIQDDTSTPAIVCVRAAVALLDIGYGPAEEGEPLDDDEP